MPCGLFWTRDETLTPNQVEQANLDLLNAPVQGTAYLLEEGEAYLVCVPHRWRN